MKKNTKFLYYILFLIFSLFILLGLLERHSAAMNISMFSVRNIVEVSLFFVIGVPIIMLLKRIFSVKLEVPIVMLFKRIFSKKK